MEERRKVGFIYTIEHIGVDGKIISSEQVHNLMPTVGVDYLLNTAFKSGSAYASWYVSLYEANRTPLAADTMTTLLADCTENTGYTTTGSNRLAITFPAVSVGTLSTIASPNVFDFVGAATIRGAFITSNITRGNNSGLLMSAVLFPSPKVLAAGESLRVPVGFALVAV